MSPVTLNTKKQTAVIHKAIFVHLPSVFPIKT